MVNARSQLLQGADLPPHVMKRIRRGMTSFAPASTMQKSVWRKAERLAEGQEEGQSDVAAVESFDLAAVSLPHEASLEQLPEPPSAEDTYQQGFLADWLKSRPLAPREMAQGAKERPRPAHATLRVPIIPRKQIPAELGEAMKGSASPHGGWGRDGWG